MALQKVKSFTYRPSKRRLEQLGDPEAHRISLLKAGDGTTQGGKNYVVRLLLMLVAVVGLGFALAFLLR